MSLARITRLSGAQYLCLTISKLLLSCTSHKFRLTWRGSGEAGEASLMVSQKSLLLCLLVAGAFGDCVAPADITLSTETWVPDPLIAGSASFIVVSGSNDQSTSFTWSYCTVTLTQGDYSFGSTSLGSCPTSEVAPGATFSFQTDTVWVPQDAPEGSYTWELSTYDVNKNLAGCWSGSGVQVVWNVITCTSGPLVVTQLTWRNTTLYIGETDYLLPLWM